MEFLLRVHDLGATQWYVLHHLTNCGPSMQRELVRALQIERATLSIVVATRVGKRLIKQQPDRVDQRQKRLQRTAADTRLWKRLPDLGSVIRRAAFDDIVDAEIATAVRVLRTATKRLHGFSMEGNETMTLLVTGTTSLVGSRLLPRLIEAGVACRALVRAGKTVPSGAAAVEGDILDASTLRQTLEGVSAIVHLAAVFRSPDDALIWKNNLEGTRNLIAAAKAHAPRARFIMASTSNIYDKNTPRPGREEDAADPKQA